MSRRHKQDPGEAERLKKERRMLSVDMAEVLSTDAGTRIMNYIIGPLCGVLDVASRNDPKATRDFLDGARNVGNILMIPIVDALKTKDPVKLNNITFRDLYFELTKGDT